VGYERWQSQIDREIEKFLNEGRSEHLPGAFKPLDLDQNENVPDEWRLAYRIMADNEVLPEWIMMGKDLEKALAKLESDIDRAFREYKTVLNSKLGRDYADTLWKASRRRLEDAAAVYNNNVLTYNLKVPNGINHRALFNFEQEIAKRMT